MSPLVSVFYGSQTGCAESIAKRIYDEALDKQIEAIIAPLNDFQNSKLLEQPGNHYVIIVCSTTGNGEPPDNCAKFWRYLKRRTQPKTMLANIMYTVMGLGDTNYDKFCYMGKSLEKRMRELGAQSFFDMCAADEAMGLEDQVEPWLAALWPAFFKSFGVQNETNETSSSSGSIQEDVDESISPSMENVQAFRPYVQPSIVTYEAMFGPLSNATEVPTDIPRLQPSLYSVQPVDESVNGLEKLSLNDVSTPIEEPSASHPFPATIRSAKYLTQKNVERKVLYMELDITGSNITYQPGDSIGIKCPNREEDVIALLKRLDLGDGHQLVSIDAATSTNKTRKSTSSTANRFPSPCSVRDVFCYHVDILSSPKKAVLCALASYCMDVEERARMLVLSSKSGTDKYKQWITEQQLSFIEVLYLFPSCQPPLDHVLSLLPPLMPRFYSIATSPLNDNGHLIGIAFTVVKERIGLDHAIERYGLCTNWLDTICQPLIQGTHSSLDVKVPLFLRPTRDFTLPASHEWPIVMIGPGTGVAPFMGFLAHRYHQVSNRRQVASQVCSGHWRGGLELTDMEEDEEFTMSPAHKVACKGMYLFYGCRHRHEDWLFQQEMQEYVQNKTLRGLYTAFSRDNLSNSTEKHYVQRDLRENGALITDLMLNQGGYLYVCGDGMQMAKDVHETLRQVLETHGALSSEEAEGRLKELMTRQRYVRDIW